MIESMTNMEFDQLLNDLRGFGITSNEDLISINVRGRELKLQVANISPDDEIFAMERATGLKGYTWVQRMRCEILAKAITAINGVRVDAVPYSKDPLSPAGDDRPTRLILVDLISGWGQEVVLALWKIYMVHCQNLENELLDQLPDAQIMTEVEKRFLDRISDELVAIGAQAVTETAVAADTGTTGEAAEEAAPKE